MSAVLLRPHGACLKLIFTKRSCYDSDSENHVRQVAQFWLKILRQYRKTFRKPRRNKISGSPCRPTKSHTLHRLLFDGVLCATTIVTCVPWRRCAVSSVSRCHHVEASFRRRHEASPADAPTSPTTARSSAATQQYAPDTARV